MSIRNPDSIFVADVRQKYFRSLFVINLHRNAFSHVKQAWLCSEKNVDLGGEFAAIRSRLGNAKLSNAKLSDAKLSNAKLC